MRKPPALDSSRPYGPWSSRACDVWDVLCAARDGDVATLRELLERDPNLYLAEYWYTQPIYFAVREGNEEAARFLLDRGMDPGWQKLNGEELSTTAADRGHDAIVELLEARLRDHAANDARASLPPGRRLGQRLHGAARSGDLALVEQLLDDGADPNTTIDSAGSATFAAATEEIRDRLLAAGGTLDPFDLVFLGRDDEAFGRVLEKPESAQSGCGGVLAAACTLGRTDLLDRLLAAGVRPPEMLTECRSYLWSNPSYLRRLLDHGMDPDLPDWLSATPLHSLCERDGRGRPRSYRIECAELLLAAGAELDARDEDYTSTPLGWAARNGLVDMVDYLLAKGAAPELPGDVDWATPLAWARRRGHEGVFERLARAGARR